MRVSATLRGDRELRKTLSGLQDTKPVRDEVLRSTLRVQRNSQHLVPILTGELRKSGMNPPEPVGTPTRPAFRLSYTSDYAVFVHEDLTKLHGADFNRVYSNRIAQAMSKEPRERSSQDRYFKPRRPQEQAHFLIDPGREEFPKMVDRIERLIRNKASR